MMEPAMETTEQDRLTAEVTAAEAAVDRLRAENAELAGRFREAPTDALRAELKRGAEALAMARDRVDAAKAALKVFEKTGDAHGIVAESGKVTGTIAVAIKPGIDRDARSRLIDDALAAKLEGAAAELGVVLSAAPVNYARELPGRDAEGRTVLEIAGRVEGDRLMPAVSRAAKSARSR
ncbi:MAG: hypothetical protein U0359_12095 [Byssovorax sp.]